MRIVVIGGTGFIGRRLCRRLLDTGHEVLVLTRSPSKAARIFERGVIGVKWDGRTAEGWGHMLGADTGIVNLAGASIAARWTRERKQAVLNSRIDAGAAVLHAIERAEERPRVLVQGSAVGYYGPRGTEPVDETAAPGEGFLAEVAFRWEQSTALAEEMGVRRVVARTGVVLGPGGALAKMLPPFRFFVGGPVGSGEQMLSWVHMDDEVEAIRFALENEDASGPMNLTAPEPVPFRAFARAVGRALGRPSWLPVPGFALKALYGEMAEETLLSGQAAVPARLLELGYAFRHPDLDEALADILR